MSRVKQPDWTSLGAYTPEQAARLLGVQPRMVSRWVYGNSGGVAAIIPECSEHDGELITFLDFVQAMAIREIRAKREISLQKIRETVEVAAKHRVFFPFAREHTAYVFRDDLVLRLPDRRLIQVTGKYKNQDLMEPVVYSYLRDLVFENGIASVFTPARLGYRTIKLSPTLNFGAPTVDPCGYTVATLIDSYRAEGSVDAAAKMCGVNRDDVRLALEYEDQLAA